MLHSELLLPHDLLLKCIPDKGNCKAKARFNFTTSHRREMARRLKADRQFTLAISSKLDFGVFLFLRM